MEQNHYETVSAIALNSIFGFEPRIALGLIAFAGSPGAVFSLKAEEIDRALGPWSKYRELLNHDALEAAEKEWNWLQSLGIQYVHIGEEHYPEVLKDIPDPPVGLYIRSSTPAEQLFKRPCVSIVGTRDLSPYGKVWTERIVAALSRSATRPAIVSGFALGIDISAHLAALDLGLPTIAVLPVGIDDVYPKRHSAIARRLAATPECALISDYPPGTFPAAHLFLRRNRIVAALSLATILVESKSKGGGTMTARLASGYGRGVYCVPGRIDDVRSQGCNLLIHEKIAECIGNVEDLAEDLGLGRSGDKQEDLASLLESQYASQTEQERERIVATALLIRKERGITVEEIGEKLKIGYSEAAAWTGLLESDGFICVDLLQRCTINGKIC